MSLSMQGKPAQAQESNLDIRQEIAEYKLKDYNLRHCNQLLDQYCSSGTINIKKLSFHFDKNINEESNNYSLFTYVSLGLALTLGNRPGVHNQRGQFRSRYDHRLKTFDRPIGGSGATATSIGKKESTSESDSSYRYTQEPEPYDLPPDWNVYNDENTRDPPDNELDNLHGGMNNFLLDQFTSEMLNTLNSNRHIMPNSGRNIIHNDEINSLSKHLIQQRQKQYNNNYKNNNNNNININKLSRSIDINNNDDLTSVKNHYYNLNGELNDEENELTTGSHKSSSSLWSMEDKDYPFRVDTMNEMRYPSRTIRAHARTIGKRNQATAGRRRMIDSRSSTSTSTTQHQQQPGGQSSSPSLGPGVSSPGGIASQFMLRAARGNRQYDVPQIGGLCRPWNISNSHKGLLTSSVL
ncbi:hypothetical protein PV325_010475 [Microctonus aethiopoides]|nr:hypothetical protein PV325_010475 [Microctonus aethiopoides]